MAGLTPIPRFQAFDDDGVPVAGAKLTTYAAGTSTPLATYADASLVTPNTNPVVADAGGLFGPIYLAAAAYKFVLTDANDVTIWSQDNIENVEASNIVNADISASAAIDWSKISKVGSSLADLTTRSASVLSSGSIPDARVPASAVTQHEAALAIASSQLTGDMPDARIVESNVTQHEAALAIAGSQLTGTVAQARLGTVTGAWTTIAVDTVVQATTDLFLTGFVDASTGIQVLTDSANPPTTVRAEASGGGERSASYACIVKKNDYVKIALTGGSTATTYAIPLGN